MMYVFRYISNTFCMLYTTIITFLSSYLVYVKKEAVIWIICILSHFAIDYMHADKKKMQHPSSSLS